jgi:hypothetical protein
MSRKRIRQRDQTEEVDAWAAGHVAAEEGLSTHTNPYEEFTPKWIEWRQDYLAAMRNLRRLGH